ncbi:MAG TPA: AAA family ATPase [Rhodothermales bacterium]|nr:AAA family ATPase [Rhodothermales bacterium]
MKQLEAAAQEVADLKNADNELAMLRARRRALASELFSIVETQISTLEDASSTLAKGNLADQPDFDELETAVWQAFDLPHMRAARIEGLVNRVRDADDKGAKWQEIQDEALKLLKWKEGAPEEKEEPPSTPLLDEALGSDFMKRLYESISTESVSVLLRAILRPRVNVYHMRDGEPIEFRKASQGEQAATLLNILMNQSHGPLIVDQPEEDLDNKIINEIVKTIRNTKDERQLILATHNANIAVNGDSENVIEMVLGRQVSGGAIDEGDVRSAITEIMEGGKEAFELRRKKYNF